MFAHDRQAEKNPGLIFCQATVGTDDGQDMQREGKRPTKIRRTPFFKRQEKTRRRERRVWQRRATKIEHGGKLGMWRKNERRSKPKHPSWMNMSGWKTCQRRTTTIMISMGTNVLSTNEDDIEETGWRLMESYQGLHTTAWYSHCLSDALEVKVDTRCYLDGLWDIVVGLVKAIAYVKVT